MFTLVRHSLWSASAYPQFRRAIVPCRVGPSAARMIVQLDGVLFDSDESAWDSAEGFMYPTGSTRLPPNPAGSFVPVLGVRWPIFVPEFCHDLLAS